MRTAWLPQPPAPPALLHTDGTHRCCSGTTYVTDGAMRGIVGEPGAPIAATVRTAGGGKIVGNGCGASGEGGICA